MVMQEIGSFLTVLVVAVCAAGAVAALYATALRLWALGSAEASKAAGTGEGAERPHAKAGAIACYVACVAIVLFALWLMIPVFH